MTDSICSFVRAVCSDMKPFLHALHSKVRFASLSVTFAALTLTSFSVALPAPAQTELASVSGRVTDASGAIIVDVEVEVRSVDTGLSMARRTNQDGLYLIPSLRPGQYVINVRKPGFQSVSVTELTLNVQDNVVRNFSLQVGSITETVTVRADDVHINTQDATVSTVIDRNFVENLPMNGRTLQTLFLLTPGVAAAPGDAGQFTINGQRSDANYFTIDGVSANLGTSFASTLFQGAGGQIPGFNALGGTNGLVSVDALQEFRIQTSTFAPEFGRTPGGQISLVTRSGTNQFHGVLFDYLRNDVLDANNWFADNAGQPKPQDRQNDFGGTLGGPIRKDRTFFFFSYEGLRLRQPLTRVTVVPSTAGANPALNRQSAAPSTQPFLNAFPLPNGPDFGNGTAQLTASFSNPSSLDAYSIRLDHVVNSKFTLFGRYNYSPAETRAHIVPVSVLNVASTTTHTATLGLIYSFTPHVSNDFRANLSNQKVGSIFVQTTLGGAVPVPDTTVFPSGFSSGNAELLVTASPLSLVFGRNVFNEQRQLNFVDNLSVLHSTHELKFGIDYRWLAPFSAPRPYLQSVAFGGISGPVGILSGTAASVAISNTAEVGLLQTNFSAYGQDTWKITPRLAVTYGLRWDVNPALTGKNSASDPVSVQPVSSPVALSLAPPHSPLYATTWGNVAPRIGLAYQLWQNQGWETVVRGGFGTFYDLGTGTLGILTGTFPFAGRKTISLVALPLTAQQAAPPPITTSLPEASGLTVADPNLALPRTYEWNLALEQALGRTQSISLTYAGAAGRRLLRMDEFFSPNANFVGIVRLTNNRGSSDYHSLQVRFQRRLSHGLQALVSYTWAHSLDNASQDGTVLVTPSAFSNPNTDRGDSDWDLRHNLAASISYDIPAPRVNRIARAVLRGWAVDDLVTAHSALPVTLIGSTFFANGFLFNARPDVVPGIPLYLFGSQFPGGKALNNTPNQGGPGCKGPFCPSSAGTQGNMGRNSLRGFGAWQTDFAVRRQFHFTERLGLQFRAEFFNLFNHPNFGSPDNFLPLSTFGVSTSTLANFLGTGGSSGTLNPLYQVGGPRSIQLALKLTF